jgi:hypothetical protein
VVCESFDPFLRSGGVYSAVKLMKYLRMVGVGGTNPFKEKNKFQVYTHDSALLDILQTLINIAGHAAGFYRAEHRFDFVSPTVGLVERVDYASAANMIHGRGSIEDNVVKYLGGHTLLRELSAFMLFTRQTVVMNKLLQLLLTLLSSHSHNNAVFEISAMAGTLLIKLTSLLHCRDEDIATLALAVFVQIGARATSRESVLIAKIRDHLNPLNALPAVIDSKEVSEFAVYSCKPYQRSIAAAACMCRQVERPLCSPDELLFSLAAKNGVKTFIIEDLLKTMKCHDDKLANWNVSSKLSISDLVVLQTDYETSLKMSRTASMFSARILMSFVVHPNEPDYIESIQVEEMAAIAAIVEGLSADSDTAAVIYSPGLIHFFGKYLFLAKYMFLGKPLLNSQIAVILNGVQSSLRALARLSLACIPRMIARSLATTAITALSRSVVPNDIEVSHAEIEKCSSFVQRVRNTELVMSAEFFLNTLAVQHPALAEETKRLQVNVGRSCLEFFDSYVAMINAVQSRSSVISSNDIFAAGSATVKVGT